MIEQSVPSKLPVKPTGPAATEPPAGREIRHVPPKQDRSRASREALLDAFMSLLQERPYAEIGMADVARRAGLTTGALYGRFKDKAGLSLALHERFAGESSELMEQWAAQARWETATAGEIIRNWTRGAINFCRMYRPLLSLMLSDPAVRDAYDDLMARPPRLLATLLRRFDDGSETECDQQDIEWAARAALVVLERFDLEDDELYDRIEQMLRRLTGIH